MMDGSSDSNNNISPFQVGHWHVDPLSCEIKSADQQQKLEPKVMAVLVCLAQHAGQVVTREQLEAEVWKGRVVGYEALASAIIKLRKALADNSKQPQFIKTIPKKGYCLIAEVKYSATPPTPSQHTTSVKKPLKKTHVMGLTGFFLILLITATSLFISSKPESIANPINTHVQPSIAVLAFKNMSDDEQQIYLSDGIAADLITGLSKISSLSVIARNSTFAYRDANTDIRVIGRELGAQYIVEGSVQKSGNNIRISARLVDTATGYNLWANHFDSPLNEMFLFQDKVTSNIISALQIKLTAEEKLKLNYAYTDNIEAYDNFLRGWQHLWIMTKENNNSAREYFLKATKLDPNFARAFANLAINYVFDFNHRWSDNSAQSLQLAQDNARHAIELDSNLPQAYLALGFTEIHSREYDKAIASIQKGISLDPNFADAYVILAMALNFSGDPQTAQNIMQTAIQLNPRYATLYDIANGQIAFNLHEYDAAIKHFNSALQHNPTSSKSRLWLAASYAHVGRIDDANWELIEVSNSNKKMSIKKLARIIPLHNEIQRKHFMDGLYKATDN